MSTQEKMNWKPLIVIILSMVMMYITSFSINVLIGPIVQDLNWSVSGLQMVIVSASLIAGTLMVTAGRLGDKIGKKKVFLIGSIIYTIGLTIVVLAPNSTIFSIAWALIWPFGMVMVIPTSIALIMYFYEGGQRATAFAIYGAVLSIISAIAPVVVGYLASVVSWRIALGLSPAFGVLTIIAAFTLPETEKDSSIKIDILSVFLSVVAFGTFLIATTMASEYGWLMEKRPFEIGGTVIPLGGLSIVPIMYAIAIVLLIIFFKRGAALTAKGETPLLSASILKNIPFSIGMTVQALLYFLIAAVLFTISVFVQSAAGLDSFDTALTTLPISIGVAFTAFGTASLGEKISPKLIVIVGFIIILGGSFLLTQQASVDMTWTSTISGALVFGIGCGLVMAQIATLTMIKVPSSQDGEASGLSETMKEIVGQGFAIAFAGSILFGSVYTNMVDGYEATEELQLSKIDKEAIIIELEDTFMEITPEQEKTWVQEQLPEKTKEAYQEIVNASAEKAFQDTFIIVSIFTLISLVLSFLLPGMKLGASEEKTTA
ncbi:MFS transporter [Flammeovirga kamogawensis]|uniref:MFS transporter n=1 Tax=Flammeovirga kamogawensis TaxID=373891 RepID=A0ABX8GTM6_9BACT|nr:MFS transporter [Flammeovirga kamogawensis]MBB6462538.1 MFS family permease [Flammeovirga kamogawensis]QWG06726.1 MFS transporter [Flammeovirga kamogawensis]TRX68549.1 MFS transporter [Flammeovirga kamogawensis]